MTTYPPAKIRFWKHLPERLEPDRCWTWQGATSNGYGILSVDGRKEYAHRYSLVVHRRALNPAKVVDHKCRNRRCVNPRHLEQVSIAENVRRGAAAVTSCKHGHAYDEANTYTDRRGRRSCKACKAARRTP